MLDSAARVMPVKHQPTVVYVVFAELQDQSRGTVDGEHFLMIAGYTQEAAATQRAAKEQFGGGWGSFTEPGEPSDAGWWIGVEPVEVVG